jgi:hypothetical protein
MRTQPFTFNLVEREDRVLYYKSAADNCVVAWNMKSSYKCLWTKRMCVVDWWYCDMHAVGQQSTVETLFITVAKQRNNGSDQRFLWRLTPACTQQSKALLFSTGSGPAQQCGSVFLEVRPRGYITRVFSEPGQLVKELVIISKKKTFRYVHVLSHITLDYLWEIILKIIMRNYFLLTFYYF